MAANNIDLSRPSYSNFSLRSGLISCLKVSLKSFTLVEEDSFPWKKSLWDFVQNFESPKNVQRCANFIESSRCSNFFSRYYSLDWFVPSKSQPKTHYLQRRFFWKNSPFLSLRSNSICPKFPENFHFVSPRFQNHNPPLLQSTFHPSKITVLIDNVSVAWELWIQEEIDFFLFIGLLIVRECQRTAFNCDFFFQRTFFTDCWVLFLLQVFNLNHSFNSQLFVLTLIDMFAAFESW